LQASQQRLADLFREFTASQEANTNVIAHLATAQDTNATLQAELTSTLADLTQLTQQLAQLRAQLTASQETSQFAQNEFTQVV
jgi:septal ring factor EnvC (AmiA/AmiB activator)